MADPAYRTAVRNELEIDTSRVGYVAISHVWADGLGNPHRNSLPFCQVANLQDQVNSLFGLQAQKDVCVSFFMDTLSIPVADPARDDQRLVKLSRKIAISWMSKVYTEAN